MASIPGPGVFVPPPQPPQDILRTLGQVETLRSLLGQQQIQLVVYTTQIPTSSSGDLCPFSPAPTWAPIKSSPL